MSAVDKFDVRFDPAARRLHWTLRGFWTVADVAALGAAMQAAIEPLGPPPQRYDGLCDASGFPVQRREVSDALREIEQLASQSREGRVAIVVGSMTNKLQAQRTLTDDDVSIFRDRAEAIAWLDAGRAS